LDLLDDRFSNALNIWNFDSSNYVKPPRGGSHKLDARQTSNFFQDLQCLAWFRTDVYDYLHHYHLSKSLFKKEHQRTKTDISYEYKNTEAEKVVGAMNIRTPKNVRFECQRCARCCGDTPHRGRIIYLLESEVKQISKKTGLRPLEFASPISGLGNFKYKMKKRNGICIFLKNKACQIYSIRPTVCRLYPFLAYKNDGSLVFEISEDCPGIGLGAPLDEEHFTRLAEFAKSIVKR
jgi:hypothetical protein